LKHLEYDKKKEKKKKKKKKKKEKKRATLGKMRRRKRMKGKQFESHGSRENSIRVNHYQEDARPSYGFASVISKLIPLSRR
jgi:hypothetical protein